MADLPARDTGRSGGGRADVAAQRRSADVAPVGELMRTSTGGHRPTVDPARDRILEEAAARAGRGA